MHRGKFRSARRRRLKPMPKKMFLKNGRIFCNERHVSGAKPPVHVAIQAG